MAGTQNTDAVNVAQLNQATLISNRGIAGVGAIAGLPAIDPGKNFTIGFGFGNYGNASAIAAGAQARIAQNLNFKASVSSSTGSYASSVGLGYSF